MPIDSSIALQTRQVQLQDPMDAMSRAMQMRATASQHQLQQMQLDKAQQDQAQERTLADLYRGNINPDGSVNRQAVLSAAAQQGLGARIPGLQKQFSEADEAQAKYGKLKSETGEIDFNVAKKRMDASAAALNSLLVNPNTAHDDVIRTMAGLVQNGIVTPEQGQQAIRELPGDPARLRQYLMQKGMEVMEASKRMEALQPKFDKVNSGKQTQFVDVNPITNPGGPAPVQMTTTPGEDLGASTQRRGQDLTDKRAREATEAGQTVYDSERGMIVDKRNGLARPAATLNGQPLGAKPKDLTEGQAKANLFGTRMQEANKTLDTLAEKGVVRPSVVKQAAEAVPVVGGLLGAGANAAVASPQQQQVEQAQRDFVNAVLRRESGASISPAEFESAKKQYFPQVGDSPEVIKQKRTNRENATKLMLAEVPAGRSAAPAPAAPTPSSATGTDFQLPSDIEAIYRKHSGGK